MTRGLVARISSRVSKAIERNGGIKVTVKEKPVENESSAAIGVRPHASDVMIKPDDMIDKYKVIRRLSEGQSGIVYLVEGGGGQFALKHLKDANTNALVRFRRESSSLARISHQNLLRIHDVGEFDGTPYYVMDYLAGDSLEKRLADGGVLTEQRAVEVLRSLANALAVLQSHNLVHRDIKPANIIIEENGTVKLIDFGLIGDVDQIRSETALVGTPIYCSPEQAKILKRDVDFRSDLYSLGVITFQMLIGHPPFVGSLTEVLRQHASSVPQEMHQLKPAISRSLSLVVRTLLSKDPDDRYGSATGLLADLERLDQIEQALQRNERPRLSLSRTVKFVGKAGFVERPDETALLEASWRGVRGGKPAYVLVKGPGGSGKSRLCEEFANRVSAGQERALVLRSKCQFFDTDLPLAALREAINNWLDSSAEIPDTEKAEMRKRISAAAQGIESDLLKVSRSLAPFLPAPPDEAQQSLDAETARERFYNNVAGFFVELAKLHGGLLFLVDDVQWLDQGSRLILARALTQSQTKAGSAILVVGACRDEIRNLRAAEEVEKAIGSALYATIAVSGLSREQNRRLVAEYMGSSALDPSVADLLHQKGTGLPLITLEYLRTGIENGLLQFKNGAWTVDAGGFDGFTLSDNVYELVLRRLDTASESLKRLLQFAAVLGTEFDPKGLGAAAGLGGDAIEAALAEAQQQGLLEKRGPARWRFVHEKVSEQVRQGLTDARRSEICDGIAELIEAVPEKSNDQIYSLARMYMRSARLSRSGKAVESYIRAGSVALENHAFAEAFGFLKHAYEAVRSEGTGADPGIIRKIAPRLAVCAVMQAQWKLARECADLNLSGAREDERLDAILLKTWVLKNHGDVTSAWEYFRVASAALGRPYPAYLHWKVLGIITHGFLATFLEITRLFALRRPGPAARAERDRKRVELLLDGLYCAEFLSSLDVILVSLKILVYGQVRGGLKELALGYACVGSVFGMFGLKVPSTAYFDTALEYAERLNDPYVKAICIGRKITAMTFCGVIVDGREVFNQHREFLKKYLHPAEFGRVCSVQTFMLTALGKNREALEHLSHYVDIQNPTASRIGVLQITAALNHLMVQSTLLGMIQEVAKLKKIALPIVNNYRFVFFGSRQVAAYEVLVRRYHDEVDEITDDLIEFMTGRTSFISDPVVNFNYSQSLFLDLKRFQLAKSPIERMSIRRHFKARLHRLFFTLYAPAFRVNYLFLKARYLRLLGAGKAAERSYALAEDTALRCDSRRLQFEVLLDRARMSQARGMAQRARTYLLGAFDVAIERGWQPTQKALKSEFGELMSTMPLFSGADAASRSSQLTHQTHVGTLSRGNAGSSLSSTSVVGTHMSGQGADEIYLNEALLNVSRAFTSSSDTAEQSKAVLKEITKLFGAERGFVFIFDDKAKQLRVESGVNAEGAELQSLAGFSNTVVHKVFESGMPRIVTGTDEGEALGSESAVLHNLRSIMAAPLTLKDRVLGVVYVDSTLARGLFTQTDIETFSTLANHIAIAYEIARIGHVEAERKVLEKDLILTASVQRLFLPKETTFSAEPILLSGNYCPASHASGDWWWFNKSEATGKLRVLVGDVTGHGAASAMLTASTAGILQTLVRNRPHDGIDSILDALNAEFNEIAVGEYSMTMGAVEIGMETGELRFFNAGGLPIFLMRKDGEVLSIAVSGTPLGRENFKMGLKEIRLEPGDRICILTDGITEMALPDGSQLRSKKFIQMLKKTRSQSIQDAVRTLTEELGKARADTPLQDDMTFVLIDHGQGVSPGGAIRQEEAAAATVN